MHLSQHLQLINMPEVRFMMNIRVVISDNESSDGWRPVSARDFLSHLHVKQVVQLLQEPGGVHGNGAGCLFYLRDENA